MTFSKGGNPGTLRGSYCFNTSLYSITKIHLPFSQFEILHINFFTSHMTWAPAIKVPSTFDLFLLWHVWNKTYDIRLLHPHLFPKMCDLSSCVLFISLISIEQVAIKYCMSFLIEILTYWDILLPNLPQLMSSWAIYSSCRNKYCSNTLIMCWSRF